MLLLTLAQAGCDLSAVDRVNHLHSDANQKVAEGAVDAFAKFADDRTGLAATLLKNVSTQSAHNQDVNDLRAAIDDQDFATAITNQTWNGLRWQLYGNLGVVDGKVAESVESDANVYVVLQRRLDRRTQNRYRQIQAAGSVLQALARGEEAMIFQAKANLDQAVKDVEAVERTAAAARTAGNGAPAPQASTDADAAAKAARDKLLDVLFGFRDAVIAAGEKAVETEKLKEKGLKLQQEILAAVEDSRDKASAYALVAVIGSGLSAESVIRLKAFLTDLERRLDAIALHEPTGKLDPDAAAAWDRFIAAAENARALVHAALLLEDLDVVRLQVASNRRAAAANLNAAPTGLQTLEAKVRKAGIPESLVVKPADAPAAAGIPGAEEYLKQLTYALNQWFAGPNAPEALADALPEVGSELSRLIDRFREQINNLPVSLLKEDLAEVIKTARTDPKKAALDYLQKSLRSSTFLVGTLKKIQADPKAKERFDADLDHLGGILADMGNEAAAANARVLEFLRDLYRLQLDLEEEDLRHYRRLASVAAEELRRWSILSDLNGRYRYYFADVRKVLQADDEKAFLDQAVRNLGLDTPPPPRPAAVQTRVRFRLFPDDDQAAAQQWNNPPNAAPLVAPDAHPIIKFDDRILPTLRRLAETARQWQFGSPNKDASGINTGGSHQRLYDAAELINGQLLMVSLNERFSLQNGLTLRTEIQEHGLQLDAIAERTREAGMRLGLKDLAAFHASGITEADIQAAIGIVQQVLLARISGKL